MKPTVLACLAENVWCGTVVVPSLTYSAMMIAAWPWLCGVYMWYGVLMPVSLARTGRDHAHSGDSNNMAGKVNHET